MVIISSAVSIGAAVFGAAFGVLPAVYGIGTFGLAVIGFGVQAALGAALYALTPKPRTPGALRGYQFNTNGAALDHQIIYGKVRVGGALVFEETVEGQTDLPDVDNQFLYRVYAHAGHAVEGYEEVYINNKLVTEWRRADTYAVVAGPSAVPNGTGLVPYTVCNVNVDGTVIPEAEDPDSCSNIYSLNSDGGEGGTIPSLVLRFYDGTQTTADPTLVADSAKWTTDHVLFDTAYMIAMFGFSQTSFPNGAPEITVSIKGKKVYDPRTSTTGWTDNAALCLRDYLTGDYGLGEQAANIDDTLVIAAANICDQVVDGQARYTCNGAFVTQLEPYDILNGMITAMGGLLWYAQGKWRMKPAYWVAPTITLTEDDLRSNVAVKPRHSRRDNFNIVKGTFRGPETNWQVTDYPQVTNVTDTATVVAAGAFVIGSIYKIRTLGTTDWNAAAGTTGITYAVGDYFSAANAGSGTGDTFATTNAYLDADGGIESVVDFDLPFTDNSKEARRLARIMLERNRQQITVSASFGLKAFQLQVGDVVNLSLERFGWEEKTFEVVSWSFGLADGLDIQVQLALREITADVFDELDDGVLFELDNTKLRDGFYVPEITLAVATSVKVIDNKPVRVIQLTSSVTRDAPYIDYINYYYKPSSSSNYTFAGSGELGLFEITTLPPGTYDFRARAVSTLGAFGTIKEETSFVYPGPITNRFGEIYNGAFETLDFTGWEETGFFNIINTVARDVSSTTLVERTCPFEAMLRVNPFGGVVTSGARVLDSEGLSFPRYVFLEWEELIAVQDGDEFTLSFYQAELDDLSDPDDGFEVLFYLRYFDEDKNQLYKSPSVNITSVERGKWYKIETVGTTDWTVYGAATNTVGEEFLATSSASGAATTGTAFEERRDLIETRGILGSPREKDKWFFYSGNNQIPAGAHYVKFHMASESNVINDSIAYFTGISFSSSGSTARIGRNQITEASNTAVSSITLTTNNVLEDVATNTVSIPTLLETDVGQDLRIQAIAVGNVDFTASAEITLRLFVDGVNVSSQKLVNDSGFNLSAITGEGYGDRDIVLKAETTDVTAVTITEANVIGLVLKR